MHFVETSLLIFKLPRATNRYGWRTFVVAAPNSWNKLSIPLKQEPMFFGFKTLLISSFTLTRLKVGTWVQVSVEEI